MGLKKLKIMLKYIVYNIEERICIMSIFYSILVFIFSFILLLGSYIALVATNKIKKRRMDKVLKLVAAYSLVVALVFCYQLLYL